RQIHGQLGVPVMADIATVEEAVTAAAAGADLVASTMRGYTAETESVRNFEPAFIRDLVTRLGVPVVAEGRIDRPEQAAEAIRAGAFAVIVGTAITRPGVITSRFVGAIHRERSRSNGRDRKSTRLNSSHEWISYAVFCLKKKNNKTERLA